MQLGPNQPRSVYPKRRRSVEVAFRPPPRRGEQRIRVAIVGKPSSGKGTIFDAVASTSIQHGALAGTSKPYQSCIVRVGDDEVDLVNLPDIDSLCDLRGEDREALKYLLWGDARPLVSSHERCEPPAPFSRPDAFVHVLDAGKLASGLKLTIELTALGLPMVVGLNRIDEACRKGLVIDVAALAERLGVPVVPLVAVKGRGIPELLDAVLRSARHCVFPLAQPPNPHIAKLARRLHAILGDADLHAAFRMPAELLLSQLMQGDAYLEEELSSHFPDACNRLRAFREAVGRELPRPLNQEVRADLNHRALSLAEATSRQIRRAHAMTWEDRFDAIFLHPRWGFVGSIAVFASVLYMVFELSAGLDRISSARLAEMLAAWSPVSLAGVIGRAVADGLVGLIGIVVPYMLPLVLLLIALEESGVMHRIAFVVDRFFHHIGLHGNVAVPFLLGLGCNVPAIAAVRDVARGRDRVVASLLITFVPCSARSAVVLAIGGKYLGAGGVIALFGVSMLVVATLGRVLRRRYPDPAPGVIQRVPPYAVPRWGCVMRATWRRSSDIVTIVLPLLVGGSVVLALLQYAGADIWINTLLAPLTSWALGLPLVLGVPILFGVLRKELSLLMVFQALGTMDVGSVLDPRQIAVFLVFVLLYIPCVSTFAVMLRSIGRREAVFSLGLSTGVALLVALVVRGTLSAGYLFA